MTKSPEKKVVQPSLMNAFPLIEHSINGDHIHQRPKDGYINATDMCKSANKRWSDYHRNPNTKAFIASLSSVVQICTTELIQTIQGGQPKLQGTWVHPQVAIHLGQWLSPEFAVQVSQWVLDWTTGKASGVMPPHVKRYIMNKSKIQPNYFSMLNEIYLELLAPIDDAGIKIPSKIMPDISTGRMFSQFLRDQGIEAGDFPTYKHDFPDGRVVNARLYPVKFLGDFRKWLYETWLPTKATSYFREKFPQALPHINHLLPPPKQKQK